MKYLDALFSGVKWTTISSIVVSILAILKIAIMTRFLEKAEFGQFALLTSILSFIQLFADFGISVALLHRTNVSQKDHSSLYWLGFSASLLIYLIFLALTPTLASYFQEPVLLELMPVAGFGIVIVAIGNQYRILALKSLHYRHLATVNITGNSLAFLTGIYFAVIGWGVWALVLSTLISNILMQVMFFIAGQKNYQLRFHFSFRNVVPYWNIGKYSVGGEMINYFTREIDIILIGKLSDSATLGAYSLAKQLVQKPGNLINQIINQASLPILPKFQENLPILKETFLKIVQTISSIMGVLYGIFFIFAGEAVHIFYGSSYASLASTCRIFAIFFFWRMIIRFNANLIIATGKTKLSLLMNAITFPLTALAIIIGYQWGLNGIAWGQVGMIMTLLFISWYVVLNRLLQLDLFTYLRYTIPNPRVLYQILMRLLKRNSNE